MKKNIIFLLLIFTISCDKISESKIEVNAVQQVLNFYNGKCLKSKGIDFKNNIKKKYYELAMSNSPLLENDSKYINFHSGNIAYLFYTNLKEEKLNYDNIKVKITLNNGGYQDLMYSNKELLDVESYIPKISEITKQILAKDYDKLFSQFDKSAEVNKEKVAGLFKNLVNKYGEFKQCQLQGFVNIVTDQGEKVITFKEVVVLDKINGDMFLTFNKESRKLVYISFP